MRKLSLFLALAMAVSGSSAVAATKKPSPTPTTKITTKATTKATAKPTSTASPKTTATTTTKPKPKPKPRPRKKISLSPSPKPAWPPIGYEYDAGIYAKVPSSKELIGVISAKGNLASQVAACAKFICGAVQVASGQGCLWWEVNSKLYAQNKELIGELRTVTGPSSAREYKTILLISPEPLESSEYVSSIDVACHQEAKPSDIQPMTFTKANN